MASSNAEPQLLLVDAALLPEVFGKVLEAKALLQSGQAETAAEAARLAGLSRSAFYKYKDGVFAYDAGKRGAFSPSISCWRTGRGCCPPSCPPSRRPGPTS